MATMIWNSDARPSVASEVWDIAPARATSGRCASVRQLKAPSSAVSKSVVSADDALEPRSESKDNVLLGALMAVALLVGSLFGGAFGGADTPMVDDVLSASIP